MSNFSNRHTDKFGDGCSVLNKKRNKTNMAVNSSDYDSFPTSGEEISEVTTGGDFLANRGPPLHHSYRYNTAFMGRDNATSDLQPEVTNVTTVLSNVSSRVITDGVLHFVTPKHEPATPPFSREGDISGWITHTNDMKRWHTNHNIYMLYATFGLIVLGVLSMVFWIKCKRRWMFLRYDRLPLAEESDPSFVYKPRQDGILDEEYENTFVGVSIPILQDVTKV